MTARPLASARPTQDAAALAKSLIDEWRAGAPPAAAAALRDHPELRPHRSLVVALAYEEYCLREEAGAAPECEAFCDGIPAFQSHLREVIRGHILCANNPQLFDAPPAMWPQIGDAFDGLTILDELGRGGFARVYLALDPTAGDRPVALKLSATPSVEARTIGPIDHPNIGRVLWARAIDGLHAVAMPYLGAATLHDAIAAAFADGRSRPTTAALLDAIAAAERRVPEVRGPARRALLSEREPYAAAIVRLFARIADALAELHRRGIAHGDLKPSNILVQRGGEPVLIDFNLATASRTVARHCGGTLPYMAPELLQQVVGESRGEIDGRPADVFAFGVVLHEVLTGRLPHAPRTDGDLADIANDLLRQCRSVRPALPAHVPPRLAMLVARCLDPVAECRPTAAELCEALPRVAVRRRIAWAAGLAAALLAAAIGLGTVLLARDASSAVGEGPTPFRTGTQRDTPSSTKNRAAPRAEPADAENLFQRGVEGLRNDDADEARRAFTAALRQKPEPRTLAHLAYCAQLDDNAALAEPLYRQAFGEATFNETWARNNWAFSLTALPNPAWEHFHTAIAQASFALDREPELAAPRGNRAVARLMWELRYGSRDAANVRRQGPREAAEAIDDIGHAAAAAPDDVELAYLAALTHAKFGSSDEHRRRAVAFCRDAVRLGKNAQQLQRDPVLKPLLVGVVFPAAPAPRTAPIAVGDRRGNPRLLPPPLN